MSEMLTDAEAAEVATHQGAAVEALDVLERICERYELSFPDAVREVLEVLAQRRGSVAGLVATRPGCWEAEHISALADGYDLGAVVSTSWNPPAPPAPEPRPEPDRPETVTNREINDGLFRAALGPDWTGIKWHLPKQGGPRPATGNLEGTPEDVVECRAHVERDGGWDAEGPDEVVGTVLYGEVECAWSSCA